MIKRFKSMFIVALLVVGLLPNIVSAAENSVTLTIDDGAPVASVTTLEDAFSYIATNKPTEKAKILVNNDGDPSVTTTARTFEGFDLTIEGAGETKPTLNLAPIQFKEGSFSFKDLKINMQPQATTNYTLYLHPAANKSSIVTLDAVEMSLNGTGFSVHAIIMGGGAGSTSTFNILNNSDVLVQGYTETGTKGNAIYHESANIIYNVNVIDSKFISDGNRSGVVAAAGSNIKISNSIFDVINSKGNGSNGGNWDINTNSVVSFLQNTDHGLSVNTLSITDSEVIANENGANGINVPKGLTINGSKVTVSKNQVRTASQWTIPGAIYVGGATNIIDGNSILEITENGGPGLLFNGGTLNIDESVDLTIKDNTANRDNLVGGIYAKGAGVYVLKGMLVLPQNAKIYNNTAKIEADDIFVNEGAIINFGPAHAGKLNPCQHIIDGWYYDEPGEGNRWSAHNEPIRMDVFNDFDEPVTGPLSLKAAHGLLMDISVKKVWEDQGNEDKRPDSIIVKVVGEHGDFSLELNEANQWQGSLLEIPQGEYTISEVKVPKGYTSVISNDGIANTDNPDVTITNTYTEDPIKPDSDQKDQGTDSKEKLPKSGQNILYFAGLLIALSGAGLGLRKYLS